MVYFGGFAICLASAFDLNFVQCSYRTLNPSTEMNFVENLPTYWEQNIDILQKLCSIYESTELGFFAAHLYNGIFLSDIYV